MSCFTMLPARTPPSTRRAGWLRAGPITSGDRPPPDPPAVPGRLPTDAELGAGGKQGSAAYDRAWWFARFVADEYGPAALGRFYVEACGPDHPDPDASSRAAL